MQYPCLSTAKQDMCGSAPLGNASNPHTCTSRSSLQHKYYYFMFSAYIFFRDKTIKLRRDYGLPHKFIVATIFLAASFESFSNSAIRSLAPFA